MPSIELSAFADGISYASSVLFAVLLCRRGMLTWGNLLRTFFAGVLACFPFITGYDGREAMPFPPEWIDIYAPRNGIEFAQYFLRNVCFGIVAFPCLFLVKVLTSKLKIVRTGECPWKEVTLLTCFLSGMTQPFWHYSLMLNTYIIN